MILGLFPDLAGVGGIQRAGRSTAAVLASWAEARGETCRFLSLNDRPSTVPLQIGAQTLVFSGFGRSKVRFLAEVLRAAVRRPRLTLALHPNLAPAARLATVFSPGGCSIVVAHGVEVWKPLGGVRQWSLRQASLVVGPSADTLEHVIAQQGVSRSRTSKLPWSLGPGDLGGADLQLPRPAAFPRGRVILTVGRWDASEAYKGVDHLVAAMPALLGLVPDVHLVAVGGGTDQPRLEDLARRSSASDRIHFLPFLNPEDLQAAYAHCEIFALPSKGEGFGLVFLEAMAHAKPVIGGAHGGTPEVIDDGVDGYLVEYGNVERLTACLGALLTDDSLRIRMGAQARDRVLRDFTFDRFRRNLTAILDDITNL